MRFSEKCADPDEKSYYACGNSSRPSLYAKVPLLGESTKSKQNYFSLLKTAKVVVSYVIYPTRFFLNLTDLSPSSGPARRFAEPDLGLNCLYDHSQTFSF